MDKNNSGSSDSHSNDEVLNHLLDDAEFINSLEKFNENNDVVEEIQRKVEENVEQVMTLLRGKLTIIDELDEMKIHLQREVNQEMTIYDFQRALYRVHQALNSDELFQYFAPRFNRFIEAVHAIDLIATGIIGGNEESHGKMKAHAQGNILLFDSLTIEEKEAFIQVADEFMPGETFDTSNPDDYVDFVVEAEQDKKDFQEISVFRDFAHGLIDIYLGNGNDLQTNDVAFNRLRERLTLGLFIGDMSMFQSEITDLLNQLGIEEIAYLDAIDSIQTVIDSELR